MRMIITKPTLRYILEDKFNSYLKRFGEKVSPSILGLVNMMLLCCDKRLGYRSFYVLIVAMSSKSHLAVKPGYAAAVVGSPMSVLQ